MKPRNLVVPILTVFWTAFLAFTAGHYVASPKTPPTLAEPPTAPVRDAHVRVPISDGRELNYTLPPGTEVFVGDTVVIVVEK